MPSHLDDPVLSQFRTAVHDRYGDQLARMVLYGSRARGDAGAESDYDIAVFLKQTPDWARDRTVLANIGFDVMETTGGVVNALPFAIECYAERTPIMHEIRKDGIEL